MLGLDAQFILTALGLIGIPLSLIAGAWALRKTQGEARWRSAAEASHEGMKVCNERLAKANEWVAEVEKRLTVMETQYQEREALLQNLGERLVIQDGRIAQLLEHTPEKLWEAVDRHAQLAEDHWRKEQEMWEEIQRLRADEKPRQE